MASSNVSVLKADVGAVTEGAAVT
ncbi:MAG: hypothetical protein JWR80_1230, partial [Bradyrhizobium sp.]|nr:hypothetical protein [Bradyrhizobium sp.]